MIERADSYGRKELGRKQVCKSDKGEVEGSWVEVERTFSKLLQMVESTKCQWEKNSSKSVSSLFLMQISSATWHITIDILLVMIFHSDVMM